MEINMAPVMAITIIAYLIGMACKAAPFIKNDMIPVIVGVVGGALGVAGMYVIPEFPAGDVINSVAVGILSGLASTGANQVGKLFNTKKEESVEEV